MLASTQIINMQHGIIHKLKTLKQKGIVTAPFPSLWSADNEIGGINLLTKILNINTLWKDSFECILGTGDNTVNTETFT